MIDEMYRCECCGGVFRRGCSDEVALAEMRANFGDVPEDEQAVICDECYRALMAWIAAGCPT